MFVSVCSAPLTSDGSPETNRPKSLYGREVFNRFLEGSDLSTSEMEKENVKKGRMDEI